MWQWPPNNDHPFYYDATGPATGAPRNNGDEFQKSTILTLYATYDTGPRQDGDSANVHERTAPSAVSGRLQCNKSHCNAHHQAIDSL